MKRVLLLVPDGTGIKNYLYSDVFKDTEASLSLFHNFDSDTISHIEKQLIIDSYYEIPKFSEGIKERFLRELVHLARLKFHSKRVSNPTLMKFWKRDHASLKLKVFYKAVSFASAFIKSYQGIQKLEASYDKAVQSNPFFQQVKRILEAHKPDTLFCTHQRALAAPAIFAAARSLGIATTTVIYSWDNIPKARLALKADSYLVWSEFMKEELKNFYPEIENAQIIVTGTPQFEFYNKPELRIEKGAFFSRYGLDASKKLICFSGDDVKTSPHDPHYLFDLAQAITESQNAGEYQIVFRRCPVDVSKRYDWVLEKFPELIVSIPPLWNYNTDVWTAVYPTYEDVKLLVSLAFYADLVVNVGSTMAFDFAMFKKPCIYINYDAVIDKNWSVDIIYEYQHFRSMPAENAVYWFKSASDITKVLESALGSYRKETSDWMKIVMGDYHAASKNISKHLIS